MTQPPYPHSLPSEPTVVPAAHAGWIRFAGWYSVLAGIAAFLVNLIAANSRPSPIILLIVAVVCGILVLSGFAMGLTAMIMNRRVQLLGVTTPASAGIAINGLIILLNILLIAAAILGFQV